MWLEIVTWEAKTSMTVLSSILSKSSGVSTKKVSNIIVLLSLGFHMYFFCVTDISSDPRALWRLRAECERAKCALSSATRVDIVLEYLHDGIDFYSSITRADFEAICNDLFQRVVDQLEKMLKNKDSVTEVILVGGSTRIPHIQTMISDFFGGKLPVKSLNSEMVATGAAIMAAIFSGDTSPKLQNILVLDVTPFSLGIQTAGGVITHIIKGCTFIPTKKTETFTTYADNQSNLIFRVFEGSRVLAKDNNLLGIFELSDIPPAPRGVPEIEVIFNIDANGTLGVTAIEKNTGRTKTVTVNDRLGLSRDPTDIKPDYSRPQFRSKAKPLEACDDVHFNIK